MFLENTVNHEEPFGWIEVICGSMFSGEELPESNPHETDIMTPGMDTIIDMVSHMPKKERLPQESVPETEPPQDSPSGKQAQHVGGKNTATTLNGRYGPNGHVF